MTDDQAVVIVDDKGDEHVFPAGFDPLRAASIVRGGTQKIEPRQPAAGRGTSLDVQKSNRWASTHAPEIGAGLAVAAGPAGWLPGIGMAMAGGSTFAALRGDSLPDAVKEGGKQALLEGGGRAIVGIGQRVLAPWLMKGAVPPHIAKEFDDVDIPRAMLDRGVLPGSAQSAERVAAQSTVAQAERTAAAQTVPTMSRPKIINGLRPVHREAVVAKESKIADDVLNYMRTTFKDIGPNGLDGAGMLARKTVKQRQGGAAIGDPTSAAVIPQVTNAERRAIMSHLRETPRMATALDESQTMMAIDAVMQHAKHGNALNRSRIGGLMGAASSSPGGLGATAHAVNQGANAFNPQTVRLLELLMGSRE